MNIFDGIEKLITEHGSAAILRERLEFAKAQFEDLERKVSDLHTEVGRLEAHLDRERADHKQCSDELKRLQDLHSEDVKIVQGLEFRKGKRTGGVWAGFCPICHAPVNTSTGLVGCPNDKCGMRILMGKQQLADIVSNLG